MKIWAKGAWAGIVAGSLTMIIYIIITLITGGITGEPDILAGKVIHLIYISPIVIISFAFVFAVLMQILILITDLIKEI